MVLPPAPWHSPHASTDQLSVARLSVDRSMAATEAGSSIQLSLVSIFVLFVAVFTIYRATTVKQH